VLRTKADAALMMQLGCDGGRQYFVPCHANEIDILFFPVFVGSGIFLVRFPRPKICLQLIDDFVVLQSGEPAKRARAIVQAVNAEFIAMFRL
jgi:hypothetical protein